MNLTIQHHLLCLRKIIDDPIALKIIDEIEKECTYCYVEWMLKCIHMCNRGCDK